MVLSLDTEKLARNALFTILARTLMVAASTIGIPIALLLLSRVLTAADTISEKVGAQATKIELLDQSIKFGFDAAKGDITGLRMQLTDHEGRIRVIESRPR